MSGQVDPSFLEVFDALETIGKRLEVEGITALLFLFVLVNATSA